VIVFEYWRDPAAIASVLGDRHSSQLLPFGHHGLAGGCLPIEKVLRSQW
jgi:hypothetical protein